MKRIIALLMCFVLVASVAACGFTAEKTAVEKNRISRAFIDDQNVAYLVCDSGSVLKIQDAKGAWVTAERKTLLWLSEDSSLYIAPFTGDNTDLTKAQLIDESAEILALTDKGLCFDNKDGELSRVLFADNSIVHVAKEAESVSASANMDIFFTTDGKTRFLPHDSEEVQTIGTNHETVQFWTLSDQTSEVVWADNEYTEDTSMLYYFNGQESIEIGEIRKNKYYSSLEVEASPSGDYVAVYSSYDGKLFLKAPNQEFSKIEFKGEIVPGIYTSEGLLSDRKLSKMDGVYVGVEQDDYDSIYWVTFDGDKEKILSKVISFETSQGTLYYLSAESALYKTDAAAVATKNGERITSEVDDFNVSNEYVYYVKDSEQLKDSNFEGIGTLYSYCAKESEPIKISNDVYVTYFSSYSSERDNIYCNLSFADDGKTVLYLKNPEIHKYTAYGSLFCFTHGDKEPKRIMGEVNEYSIQSLRTKLHSDQIIFSRYIDEETSESNHLFDWFFYNGKEAISIAKRAG